MSIPEGVHECSLQNALNPVRYINGNGSHYIIVQLHKVSLALLSKIYIQTGSKDTCSCFSCTVCCTHNL